MSGIKRKDQGKGKKKLPIHSNALAEALKAAGLGIDSTPGMEKRAPERQVDKRQVSQTRTKEKTDAALLKEIYQDVEPLKPSGRINQKTVKRSPRKQKSARGPSLGKQELAKDANKTPKKKKRKKIAGKRKVRSVPAVKTYTAPDGRKKVCIEGVELIERGIPKKEYSIREKHRPTTELITNNDIAINLKAMQDDQAHLYSGTLLDVAPWHISENTGDEIELVIGLDFGTAYCKAVVQEPDSGMAWAIPLSDLGRNPYILSTKVWRNGDAYNLAGKGEAVGNLKAPLLNRDMSPGHAASVIAFLVLVIRHIKAWVSTNKSDEIAGATPFWSVHMGLPARSLEDEKMLGSFRKMIWAAAVLAEQPGSEIGLNEVNRYLALAQRAIASKSDKVTGKHGAEVHSDQIGIFPEIAAQIYGYRRSDLWDRAQTTFMLVDAGGGTVDGAIFRIDENPSETVDFKFLATAIENLGVYILHRNRLDWHVKQLNGKQDVETIANVFQRMLDTNVMPAEIPDNIEDYLIGAEYPEETSDKEFYRRFANLLWDEIVIEVRNMIGSHAGQWDNLPFLLCGGGRSIGLYNRFIRYINSPDSSTSVKLHPIPMRKPANLAGEGVGEAEYQRLSVAYGLSFLNIGKVITPDMFPDPPPKREAHDVQNNYIGKEMM